MATMEGATVYMQARFYDPQVGRFLSTDPRHFDGASPFTFNRYAYANNNPYRYTDPNGEVAVAGFVLGVGLEITRQVLTGEISNTSVEGIAANIGKAAVAGLAGAAGVGLGAAVANVVTRSATAALVGQSLTASATTTAVAGVTGATAGGSVAGAVASAGNTATTARSGTDSIPRLTSQIDTNRVSE